VRRIRQLIRKRSLRWSERLLVVEGAELLSVALDAGAPVESVYVAPEGHDSPAVEAVSSRAFEGGSRVFDLEPGVLERVADTVTPQPVLAVVGFEPPDLGALRQADLVVVCADVRDPGNAGTLIRTADAAGADGVVCCDGTVDPYNPKTVRASAGSVFHLPIVAGGDVVSVVETLREFGLRTLGTVVRDGVEYDEVDLTERVALVFGNEASGMGDEVLTALDVAVTIPMAGRAESLNVSVSAAVLCFEVLRQRRQSAKSQSRPGRPGGTAGQSGQARQSGQPGRRTDAGATGSTMPEMETRPVGETTDGGSSTSGGRSPSGGSGRPSGGSSPS
jgi:TrmH family RNA methyltransferase